MKTIKTYMVRKPSDLEEVEIQARTYPNKGSMVEIAETIELTPEQYDAVCTSPLRDYPFLAGKGGYEMRDGQEVRQVVELTCTGQQSLYADPSGSSYCRYLGICVK